MKFEALVLMFLLVCSCSNNQSEEVNKPTKVVLEDGWNYREVSRDYMDTLMLDVCSSEDLEFIDLYSITDSIAADQFEKLVLIDALKNRGFEVTQWGRGNWMKGPRIVNYTVEGPNCKCHVDKLYYSTKHQNEFRVTERISCEAIIDSASN